jgi:2-amino-4-hydroxy-6-hydroxymethyldihydropteridine diphosphokinase
VAVRFGWHQAFVALGSNLGDRTARLQAASARLEREPEVELVARSRIFETEPVGPPQGRYLNAVVELSTSLEPRSLLARLFAIEALAGRRRTSQRNEPRSLDLDLLLYDDVCLDEADLIVPHPRMHERGFVLEPLCDLAPDLVHPRLGLAVQILARRVRDPGAVVPYESRGEPGWPSSP